MTSEDGVRLDRWLWAARLFRTRRLAAAAASAGHVEVAGVPARPARRIRVGDELTVTRGKERMTLVVEGLADRRGPASAARELYVETPESVERRALARRREHDEHAARPGGRPTKRDRRRMERARGDRGRR